MNRYKEIKTLGKGSFGRAALVQELSTKKQFVMKIIQISAMKPQEREEALQESKILEKLAHPYITGYKESFTDQRFLYIVMEFANGGDLHDTIRGQKTRGQLFDEQVIWDWFIQITLALKHIHDRRILHRDLKTQNIFMDLQSGKKICKIGDFGVSKILNSTMECARTAIGTPYYLSPELCNNQGYNNKSDVWALGCILYELCTLNHTFEAANMKMLIVKILEGKYTPISSKYSQNMRDLCTAMLQKDPKKRPSVNTILKLPCLQERIQKQLPDEVLQDEFAHTVFHGKGDILKGFNEQKPSVQPGNVYAQKENEQMQQYKAAVVQNPVNPPQNAVKQPAQVRTSYPSNQPPSRVNYPQNSNQNKPQVINGMQPGLNVKPVASRQDQENNLINQAKQQDALRQREIEALKLKNQQMAQERAEFERRARDAEMRERKAEASKRAQMEEDKMRNAAIQQQRDLQEQRKIALEKNKQQYQSQWQSELDGAKEAPAAGGDAARAQYMARLKRENPKQYLIEVQKRKDQERLDEMKQRQKAKDNEPEPLGGWKKPQSQVEAPQAAKKQPVKRYDPYARSEESSDSDFGDQPDQNFNNKANAADEWKKKLTNPNAKESLCYRMESLRAFMEKELGFDSFVNVYGAVMDANDNDNELDGDAMRRQLGADNMGYLNLIVQLIMVEQRFNECQ
ncbi:Kinase, NEK [Spironucleus salmonicida]|uniref:non-specific serine/threonine protein kinase n=1 Tax=Spironucleus salmonicida TaxID=348837 RepID=V6M7J4_9EUKA|nr:Kinase, NEK [Spironucleus salmonicida]|eukprot:EST49424.1 Kinase, NEK [Spironucleus salmonicida]